MWRNAQLAGVAQHQGIAIGGQFHQLSRGAQPTPTGSVFDHKRLTQDVAEFLGQGAGHKIRAAPGHIADQNFHRFDGVILGRCP